MTDGDHEFNEKDPSANDRARTEIGDWVKDIVALEAHVEEALDRQVQLEPADPHVKQTIQTFHDTVRESKYRAENHLETLNVPPSKGLVERGAELLGMAAGIIDKLRHDTVSKAMRDDYTAFNHLAISYTMLYTTALAAGDQPTASFAEQGLRTYAGLVQQVNDVISKAVLGDLKANTDMPVRNEEVASQVRHVVDEVWKSTSA